MQTSLEAVGASDIFRQENNTNHLAGTARMGDDPTRSVVNSDCRTWDIPNLWVCDGSVFPTTGGVIRRSQLQASRCEQPAGSGRWRSAASYRRGRGHELQPKRHPAAIAGAGCYHEPVRDLASESLAGTFRSRRRLPTSREAGRPHRLAAMRDWSRRLHWMPDR